MQASSSHIYIKSIYIKVSGLKPLRPFLVSLVLSLMPGLTYGSFAKTSRLCGASLVSTAQTLFGGLSSHVKALKNLKLSTTEQDLLQGISSRKIQIGIHESRTYERSEPLPAERVGRQRNGNLVLEVHRWPSRVGLVSLQDILVSQMSFETRDGMTFWRDIVEGHTQTAELRLEVKIDYSLTSDAKTREHRREAVLRVRLLRVRNGIERLEAISLPVMQMTTNLALQHLSAERNLSVKEIVGSIKPVMGGLKSSSWIDYQLNEVPLSLASIIYLPKVIGLKPSEFSAMKKALGMSHE